MMVPMQSHFKKPSVKKLRDDFELNKNSYLKEQSVTPKININYNDNSSNTSSRPRDYSLSEKH